MGNLAFTYDPLRSTMGTYVEWSHDLGFIRDVPRTDILYDLVTLNAVLTGRGLPPVA